MKAQKISNNNVADYFHQAGEKSWRKISYDISLFGREKITQNYEVNWK